MTSAAATPVLVAVVDSGWAHSTPDARVRRGVGLVDPADDLALLRTDDDDDRNGHGTACTRIILEGAPRASILPIRVFGERLETSVDHLREALQVAAEFQARIVNMSLATLRRDALVPLYAACEGAARRGILIVAAADAQTRTGFPAVFDNVIGVKAGRVANAAGYAPLSDGLIDFEASGFGPRGAVEERLVGSNSYAAARLTGVVARRLGDDPGATLDEMRSWLSGTQSVFPNVS